MNHCPTCGDWYPEGGTATGHVCPALGDNQVHVRIIPHAGMLIPATISTPKFFHGGVWCCENKSACKWQGYALHQGLGWGTIPPETNEWRMWHNRECGGKLIQLVPPQREEVTNGGD